MRTITLDANIYVSALAFQGQAELLIERIVGDPNFRIAVSDAIVNEVRRVLRQKFDWSPTELREGEEIISEVTFRVAPLREVSVIDDDPTDNRVVECAIASGSDCIISGDKHLLRIGEYEGIRMLRIAEFLREL